MLYLSHGKAKEKKEKKERKRVFPECPGIRHSGKAKFFLKKAGAFPKCLGTWHSGKGKLKKEIGSSPSAWACGTRGRGFKNTEFLPRVLHSGKRFKKRKFLPRVLQSGKRKKFR
jgi:hypothetical protein